MRVKFYESAETFKKAEKIDFPDHRSEYKELGRGRLLFYVTFRGGKAYLDVNRFYKMIGLQHK